MTISHISADEQVCKYYFLALQSNRLNIQRFPFNPINSTQSTCDLMPPGALWMKVDENIRGTTCISDAGFLHLPQYFFIAKVCFAQCSTSWLALGSPGCCSFVTMPKIAFMPIYIDFEHWCGIFSESPGWEYIKNDDSGCQIQNCQKRIR